MISNKGLVALNSFMSSCDELISGKFLFAQNKVSNILKAINESQELYDIINECLKSFNYDKEFDRAKIKLPTKKGTFKMPEENIVKIPLVFCMLVDIQSKKIELDQFLADYFDTDDDKTQFQNFANQVIVPFKNAIAYLFDIEGENKYKQQEETEEPKEEKNKIDDDKKSKATTFFEEIKETIDDILKDMEYIKIKQEAYDDIEYMANNIKHAIDKQDLKMVNALVIGLCYVLKQVKKLRFYETELRMSMESMYLD